MSLPMKSWSVLVHARCFTSLDIHTYTGYTCTRDTYTQCNLVHVHSVGVVWYAWKYCSLLHLCTSPTARDRVLCRRPCYRSICRECTNACIPAVFQQVCLTLANNFSTGLWLSTALCCISVPHLQPEIECHVDGHVIDQSAVRGRCGQMESR